MERIFLLIIVLVMCLTSTSEAFSNKDNLAVMDFGSRPYATSAEVRTQDLGGAASDYFIHALLKNGFAVVDIHWLLLFVFRYFFCRYTYFRRISAQTFCTAAGRRIHSASSITRFCKISGVSPSWISTAFCRMISPPSGISLTKCTVAPVTLTP